MILELALLLVGAYLLGSIPFGVLVARAKGVDVMKVGSGNTGATNVMRALGKGPGFLVFFLDLLKGLIPALVARWLFPDRQELWMLGGAMAIIGHSFSPFLKFKGGKGISTALGMTLGTSPIVALISFAIFVVLIVGLRYMSLASMIAVVSTIVIGRILGDSMWVTVGFSLLAALVIFRHRSNIQRLRNGTEPKFKLGRTIETPPPTASDEESTSAS